MSNQATTEKKNPRAPENWQGMNWIRQEKRLAIYLRDGLACAYCGKGVEDEIKLSLDHIQPFSQGGSNHESNLVTCCSTCNSSRGARPIVDFANAVAAYVNHGRTGACILHHIQECSSRPLKPFKAKAKEMVELRGSCARALAEVG